MDGTQGRLRHCRCPGHYFSMTRSDGDSFCGEFLGTFFCGEFLGTFFCRG
jgi:hypothetical protein